MDAVCVLFLGWFPFRYFCLRVSAKLKRGREMKEREREAKSDVEEEVGFRSRVAKKSFRHRVCGDVGRPCVRLLLRDLDPDRQSSLCSQHFVFPDTLWKFSCNRLRHVSTRVCFWYMRLGLRGERAFKLTKETFCWTTDRSVRWLHQEFVAEAPHDIVIDKRWWQDFWARLLPSCLTRMPFHRLQ